MLQSSFVVRAVAVFQHLGGSLFLPQLKARTKGESLAPLEPARIDGGADHVFIEGESAMRGHGPEGVSGFHDLGRPDLDDIETRPLHPFKLLFVIAHPCEPFGAGCPLSHEGRVQA